MLKFFLGLLEFRYIVIIPEIAFLFKIKILFLNVD